jgi:hypothetical protein
MILCEWDDKYLDPLKSSLTSRLTAVEPPASTKELIEDGKAAHAANHFYRSNPLAFGIKFMSALAPIPDQPQHCSEPPLWADSVL